MKKIFFTSTVFAFLLLSNVYGQSQIELTYITACLLTKNKTRISKANKEYVINDLNTIGTQGLSTQTLQGPPQSIDSSF